MGAGEGLRGAASDGYNRPFSESFLASFSKQGLVLILSGVEECKLISNKLVPSCYS